MDHLLVDRLVGASLRLSTPLPGWMAIRFDTSVEDATAFYTTVFKDGGLYRMYCQGALFERKSTCYAESRDGNTCTKPDRGLVSVDASSRNHVILNEARQFVAMSTAGLPCLPRCGTRGFRREQSSPTPWWPSFPATSSAWKEYDSETSREQTSKAEVRDARKIRVH